MFEQAFVVIYGAAVRPDGTPSGAMRDRVGAAVRFGRRLLPHPIYIVTGAQGRYGPAECDVMAQLLMERGVAPEYIVLEPTGTNTLRSTLAVASLMHGVPGPVYAATSSYHMLRCVLLLGLAGLDAHRSPPAIGAASSRLRLRWYWRLREIPAVPVDAVLMLWHRWRGIRPLAEPEMEPEDEPHDRVDHALDDVEAVEAEPVPGELPQFAHVGHGTTQEVTLMSVFGTIMSKIFGHPAEAAPAPAGTATPDATAPAAPAGGAATPAQPVDVEAVLTDMAGKAGQTLNWQSSIVDLMKLLNLDSGLENRKTLAGELGYTGDTNDSATMNIWLHKQVMTKLAENGGTVPASLKG